MDYQETLAYIHGINRYARKQGLDNIRRLMRELGDPQDRLVFIHIAGTNGKGSTAAMTAGALRAAGYRTGLYTSPYLNRFTERIRVDGAEIPEGEVVRLAGAVRRAIEAVVADGYAHPTELEVVAAIAFLYFDQEKCDAVALEVGLGGRFDPTNVIKAPLVAAITTIAYDHMAKLGNTLEQIAFEKAGVIKPGGAVALYRQPDGVRRVFEEAAEKAGAKLKICDFSSIRHISHDLTGQKFDYGPYKNLEISLLGDFQTRNAALVADVCELINRDEGRGLHISEDALRLGLKNARWPGRMELLREDPPVVVDAAHNAQCAGVLREALEKYFPGKKIVYVFGVVRDKEHGAILEETLPLASAVFTVTTESHRAVGADELADIVSAHARGRLAGRVQACGSVAEAARRAEALARETDAVVCAFGSLYYIGVFRELYV